MIRVVVADDNAIVRGGLCSLLATLDGVEVVGTAATGQEAIEQASIHSPDVVLLDVRMPVLDGVAAASVISRRTRVLMLTYSDEPEIVTAAIRAGAAGYLVHGGFEPAELASAIRTVHEGGSLLSPAVAPGVFEALRAAPAHGDDRGLTEREREVMDMVVRGRSNADIGRELYISAKTVKNHINHIYAKLGVSQRAEAVAAWLGLDAEVGR